MSLCYNGSTISIPVSSSNQYSSSSSGRVPSDDLLIPVKLQLATTVNQYLSCTVDCNFIVLFLNVLLVTIILLLDERDVKETQTVFIFVYNFYRGVNFCGKQIAVTLFCGNYYFGWAKKPQKWQKLAPAKTFGGPVVQFLITSVYLCLFSLS